MLYACEEDNLHGEGKSAWLQGSHVERMGSEDVAVSTPSKLFLFSQQKKPLMKGS